MNGIIFRDMVFSATGLCIVAVVGHVVRRKLQQGTTFRTIVVGKLQVLVSRTAGIAEKLRKVVKISCIIFSWKQ